MANLTGKWQSTNGYTGTIKDTGGVLALSHDTAPWTDASFGAWGHDSANQDAGNSKAGIIVFVYPDSKTDTETFLYDAGANSISFANKQVWTKA